jgi:hypothetical protein
LPNLITVLRSGGADLAPLLTRGRIFPGRLSALDEWVPPWRAQPDPEDADAVQHATAGQGIGFLATYPAACDALASLLGC